MDRSEGLVQRKHILLQENGEKISQSIDDVLKSANNIEDDDDKEAKKTNLTLMEELLLLGIKDKEGYTSFWNNSLSIGLRGCVLIELGLCERIQLEPATLRRKGMALRKIILINDTPTGDVLLDETIKHIKSCEQTESVQTWIQNLNGESWNPLKAKYQLKNVRERIAKNLVEKGVLTTEKTSYILFDMTTHPLADDKVKTKLIKKLQDALLSKWVNDVQRISKRTVALILLAYYSDVLENLFLSMNDFEYELVANRMQYLLGLDFLEESQKPNSCEIIWAVLTALIK